MSNTTTKPIKALLNLAKLSPKDLLAVANAVHDGVFGDSAFANMTSPVDKAKFEGAIANFVLLSTQAADGSKKAIAARNNQGAILIKILRDLAHWVEANCNDNLQTFLASGFHAKTGTMVKTQPVSESIRKIRSGKNSGEIEIVLVDFPDALDRKSTRLN